MIKSLMKTIATILMALITAGIVTMLAYSPEDEFIIPEGSKFIAHRGHSSEFYENSEQAFLSAAQSEFFFGIETDIWLTSDDVWVCAHDANPFENDSIFINDITYEQTLTHTLKASSDYPENDTNEVRLVTLERYLEICYEYDKMAFIELKHIPQDEEIIQLVDFVESVIPLERTQFISFKNQNTTRLLEINPDLRTLTLCANLVTAVFLLDGGYNIGMNQNNLTEGIIQKVKEKQAKLNVWAVMDKEKALELMDNEVDYITTDYIFDI